MNEGGAMDLTQEQFLEYTRVAAYFRYLDREHYGLGGGALDDLLFGQFNICQRHTIDGVFVSQVPRLGGSGLFYF